MNTIEEAIEAFRLGKLVIVADDEERENEGDLILPAENATVESIAFMIRHTSGVLCVPMLSSRLDELHIPPMVSRNTESMRADFTVSVDVRKGTTSGISAADRAKTIQALTDPNSRATHFNRPGHIFPLRYREGGVLKRAGHTEASIDLAKLAGAYPATVIGEMINDDGSMARIPDLKRFSKTHDIPLITVADLVRYRRKQEKLVECISQAKLPTHHGEFRVHVYASTMDQIEHLAIVKGEVKGKENILVRVHSECLTGDVFGSRRCDCGSQLDKALEMISKEGEGVLVYLRGHEGRGIGLGHKVRAYHLQDQGHDTVEANEKLGLPIDSREYGIGAQILADLGLSTIRLLTNNPAKYGGIAGYDLNVTERIPILCEIHTDNERYLRTKRDKLGHHLEMTEKEQLQ